MSGGELELETEIAEDFQLGEPQGPLELTAEGWGGHNRVFRLATTTGVWAVKRHGRRPLADPAAAFAIEATAHAGGVPMAPPVVTAAGHGWTEIGGVTFRCHGWIDGATKQNEQTSGAEAGAMGRIVARLHGLRISAPQPTPAPVPIPRGGRSSLGWAAAQLGRVDLLRRWVRWSPWPLNRHRSRWAGMSWWEAIRTSMPTTSCSRRPAST